MIRIKNLLLLFGIIFCFSIGTVFFNFEATQSLYSFPLNLYQYNTCIGNDTSKLGSDGPIIIYENGTIISYSIIPQNTYFIISQKIITKTDSLFCFVDETKRKFGFLLKDTIKIEKDAYELPDKMLAISDIHGNFKGLEMILTGAGVVDENLNWNFGKGHLIFDGDMFDRGINTTEILWLIYKLENEAEKQGGKVHFILGNHEIMNMKGNYKYVRNKYFIISDTLNFDYKKWYASDTELGRWLRNKNSIEKIGDYLFLHGGISKDFSKLGNTINDINNNIRKRIDIIYQIGEISNDNFIGKDSPLWYRGLIQGNESQEEVEKTLTTFGASKMILGHTIIEDIKYFHKEKVIAINVDHEMNTDNGQMFALWFENNKLSVVDIKGNKTNLK